MRARSIAKALPRIGIDGYNLAIPKGTGVASYGYTLAGVLHEAGFAIDGVFGIDAGRDRGLREVLFFDRFVTPAQRNRSMPRRVRDLAAFRPKASEVPLTAAVERAPLAERLPPFDRVVTSPRLFEASYRRFRRTGRFTVLRMDSPPDIMHWTYPVPIILAGAKNIYTLHDLVPLRLPYAAMDAKRAYKALVQKCVGVSDHICTVSETSRSDIITLLGAPPDKVTNTYQASDLDESTVEAVRGGAEAVCRGVFDLPYQGYFLFCGSLEPKKNVGRLVEAYLTAKTAAPLVIVAGRSWQADREAALIEEAAARPRSSDQTPFVIRIDYLPKRLLMSLMAGARAVLFPSLYEGFGLPVAEAMILGVPVLTSTTPALGEVAGDAALFVDAYDVGSIRAGIERIDEDAGLRDRFVSLGSARAALFSRERYRDRLEAMYGAVLGSTPDGLETSSAGIC